MFVKCHARRLYDSQLGEAAWPEVSEALWRDALSNLMLWCYEYGSLLIYGPPNSMAPPPIPVLVTLVPERKKLIRLDRA